jgi:cell wall-associated NlpC family hydrolase
MRSCTSLSRPARITAAALSAALLPVVLATPALADTAPAPGPSAGSSAREPAATSLRLTVPRSVRPGTTADISVRLLQGKALVEGATVVLQRQEPTGWAPITSMTTRKGGLGHARIKVGKTSRYRAYFRGDASHQRSLSPQRVVTATATLAQKVLVEAKRHQGTPYQWGASGPSSFDCSGFTRYVFSRFGRELPRTAAQQASATQRVAAAAKKPGDLIFTHRGGGISHVGIYAGNNVMWAAPKAGDHVRLQSLYTRDYTVGRVG